MENKKLAMILALTNIFLLVLLAGYPMLREKMDEAAGKEVFLEQGQDMEPETEDGPEVQENKNLKPNGKENRGKSQTLPNIILRLEGDPEGFQVSLWQGEDGSCYFFLPGFAKGKGLILDSAESGSICIGDSEIREGDILQRVSEGKSYEFSVPGEDGTESMKTWLFFMYSSDLPVLSLATNSGSMEYIESKKGNEEAGNTTLYNKNGELIYTGQAESIKGRGNSTWGLSKKPYQIKLCEDVDFFGFGEAKSWNLLANGYDETRLRNQIVSGMAEELGMNYVPQGQMIDLYINDSYWGNYFLTEKVRVDEGGVAIRDMEKLTEAVYSPEELLKLKPCQNEDGTRKWVETGLGEEDITGGYLLGRELDSRFKTEISGFKTDQGDCYTLQSPLYASEDQVNYIADLMQEFQDAIEEKDGIHPLTGKHYSEYIDVESFVQKYLVEEISKNFDGGVTSSFFYKPQDSVSSKIFAGPVWDYDVAFGNCNLDKIASNPVGITKLNDHVYGTDVFVRLYEKEDFYNQMIKMYEEKALPYLNTLLDGKIDEMAAQSRESAQMDSIRWEELENRYQYYQEYDNDVRYLKYFVKERRDFLSRVWLEGESYHNIAFVVDGEVRQLFCVKDGETPGAEPIPSRYIAGSLFMGWFTEDGIPYDGYKPVYEDMTFYASWQELLAEEIAENP